MMTYQRRIFKVYLEALNALESRLSTQKIQIRNSKFLYFVNSNSGPTVPRT